MSRILLVGEYGCGVITHFSWLVILRLSFYYYQNHTQCGLCSMNFINMEIWKNLIEINIQVFVKCYFYSLLLLFPYYSSKMLFLKYLYNHGDW